MVEGHVAYQMMGLHEQASRRVVHISDEQTRQGRDRDVVGRQFTGGSKRISISTKDQNPSTATGSRGTVTGQSVQSGMAGMYIRTMATTQRFTLRRSAKAHAGAHDMGSMKR